VDGNHAAGVAKGFKIGRARLAEKGMQATSSGKINVFSKDSSQLRGFVAGQRKTAGMYAAHIVSANLPPEQRKQLLAIAKNVARFRQAIATDMSSQGYQSYAGGSTNFRDDILEQFLEKNKDAQVEAGDSYEISARGPRRWMGLRQGARIPIGEGYATLMDHFDEGGQGYERDESHAVTDFYGEVDPAIHSFLGQMTGGRYKTPKPPKAPSAPKLEGVPAIKAAFRQPTDVSPYAGIHRRIRHTLAGGAMGGLVGVGVGGLTGAGGAAGATIGGLHGMFSDPGVDEEGKKRSRMMAALRGSLGGGALGAAGGLAAGVGGLAGGAAGGTVGASIDDWPVAPQL